MSSTPTPIARQLLDRLIHAVPEFTNVEPYRDKNLNTWRTNGSYLLTTSSKGTFTLQISQREYGGALFAEGQHLLNHAAENRAHLLALLNTGQEPSPSWAFVTLYYFAFFVAMAWTRASNSAIVFLDKDAIDKFCAGAAQRPGAGAFEVQAFVDPITDISYARFRKCALSHFHEAVWQAVYHQVSLFRHAISDQSSSRKPTDEELLALRGLALFEGVTFKKPLVWQSLLRNAVNYRPGFSYRSVVKNNFLRTTSRLSGPALSSLDEVVAQGERAKANVRGFDHPSDAPNDSIDLLLAQVIFLEQHTEEAFVQLCKMNSLETSAFSQRKKYKKASAVMNSILSSCFEK